jgi:hypothetical protein
LNCEFARDWSRIGIGGMVIVRDLYKIMAREGGLTILLPAGETIWSIAVNCGRIKLPIFIGQDGVCQISDYLHTQHKAMLN